MTSLSHLLGISNSMMNAAGDIKYKNIITISNNYILERVILFTEQSVLHAFRAYCGVFLCLWLYQP